MDPLTRNMLRLVLGLILAAALVGMVLFGLQVREDRIGPDPCAGDRSSYGCQQ